MQSERFTTQQNNKSSQSEEPSNTPSELKYEDDFNYHDEQNLTEDAEPVEASPNTHHQSDDIIEFL